MTRFVKRHAMLMALAAISMTLGCIPAHAIVGGQPTTIQQHPWQVYIKTTTNLNYNESKICGGIIVSRNYILTARHCVAENNTISKSSNLIGTGQIRFICGNTAIPSESDFIQNSLAIDSIIEYEPQKYTIPIDVVLLHTSQPLDSLNMNIKAIEYARNQDAPETSIQMTGWGGTIPNATNEAEQLQVTNNLSIINPKPYDFPLGEDVYDDLVQQEKLADIFLHVNDQDTISKFVKYHNRPITMVNINGFKIPFYVSTGLAMKINVPASKWYPFFGFGVDKDYLSQIIFVWFNKLGDEMADYYGSAHLRGISEALDRGYGDIRDNQLMSLDDDNSEPVKNFVEQVNNDFIKPPTTRLYTVFQNIVDVIQRCVQYLSGVDLSTYDIFQRYVQTVTPHKTGYLYGKYYKCAATNPISLNGAFYMGDEGGPITTKIGNKDILIGISSWQFKVIETESSDQGFVSTCFVPITPIYEWLEYVLKEKISINGDEYIKPNTDNEYHLINNGVPTWSLSPLDTGDVHSTNIYNWRINSSPDNANITVKLIAGRCDSAILTAWVGGSTITKKIYACDSVLGPDMLADQATYRVIMPGLACDNWTLSNPAAFEFVGTTVGNNVEVRTKQFGQKATLTCAANGVEFIKQIESPTILGPDLIKTRYPQTYSLSNKVVASSWQITQPFVLTKIDNTLVRVKNPTANCQDGTLTAVWNGIGIQKSIKSCDTIFIFGKDIIYEDERYTLPTGYTTDTNSWKVTNNAFEIYNKSNNAISVRIKRLGQSGILKCMVDDVEFTKRIASPPAPTLVGPDMICKDGTAKHYSLSDNHFKATWNAEPQLQINDNVNVHSVNISIPAEAAAISTGTKTIIAMIGNGTIRIEKTISVINCRSIQVGNEYNGDIKLSLQPLGLNVCVPLNRNKFNLDGVNGITGEKDFYLDVLSRNQLKWVIKKIDDTHGILQLRWNNAEYPHIRMNMKWSNNKWNADASFTKLVSVDNNDINEFIRLLQSIAACGTCISTIERNDMVNLVGYANNSAPRGFPRYRKSAQTYGCSPCGGGVEKEYLFFPTDNKQQLYLQILVDVDKQNPSIINYRVDKIVSSKITPDICRSIKEFIQKKE